MSVNIEKLKDSKNMTSFVMLFFISSGIGAIFGLIAYVKEWF